MSTVHFRVVARAIPVLGAALALLAVSAASPAFARTETLRFTHPDPSGIKGFQVHYGTQSRFAGGSYVAVVDIGKPSLDAGVFNAAVDFSQVPDGATIYLSISAYDFENTESPLSNEGTRQPAGAGSPPDSGGSPGAGGNPPPSSTPPAGASWYEDFEGSAPGSYVPGWVDTAAGSLASQDSLFSVVDLGGDRALSTSSTDVDIHSHLVTTVSLAWSAYEMSGRLRFTDPWSRLGVTAHSRYDQADAYYRLGSNWGTAELEIFGRPWNQSGQSCSSPGTGVIPQPNTWYRYRFQVDPEAGGTQLRAKVWRDGDAEPAGWQADCYDASANRPTAGTVGVWSGSAGVKYWDDFSIVELDQVPAPAAPAPVPLGPPGKPVLVVP